MKGKKVFKVNKPKQPNNPKNARKREKRKRKTTLSIKDKFENHRMRLKTLHLLYIQWQKRRLM